MCVCVRESGREKNKGKFRTLAKRAKNEMKAEFSETRIKRFRKWNIGWRK